MYLRWFIVLSAQYFARKSEFYDRIRRNAEVVHALGN